MTIAVRDDVQEMSSYLDNLRAALNGLDDNGITHTLRDIETISRKTHLLMLEAVAEAEARGIAAREGFGTTARLLATMLRLSATEARARVEHACAVSTRRTITGETLPPQLPATAAGLGAGAIGTAQLRLIAETMAAIPPSVPEPLRERVEADLAATPATTTLADCACSQAGSWRIWTPTAPNQPPTTPHRARRSAGSCGFATDGTGDSGWRAGSIPNTAPWCAR